MESLANISEKFLDNFPEYVTYPERKRLVDADKVRLGVAFSPYIFITPFLQANCFQPFCSPNSNSRTHNHFRCSSLPGTAAWIGRSVSPSSWSWL